MSVRNSVYKLGLISMSTLMGLSVCAPALSASAKQRSHHTHHARKAHLSKKEQKALKKDKHLVKQVSSKIRSDSKLLHHRYAHSLYSQLRKKGYSKNQSLAVMATAFHDTYGTFINSTKHGYFGLTKHEFKVSSRLARKNHKNPNNVIAQMDYLNKGHRNSFKRAKGSTKSLYYKFNKHYVYAPKTKKVISRRAVNHYISSVQNILGQSKKK